MRHYGVRGHRRRRFLSESQNDRAALVLVELFQRGLIPLDGLLPDRQFQR
jgi:hypothetical protein